MSDNKEPQRDYALDVLRAVAAIYIIGFWHHVTYIDMDLLKTPLTRSLAVIALGAFFTVSAYLLTQQQMENIERTLTSKDYKNVIKAYYSKRVFRIYPLYALAVLLFYAFEVGRWTVPHLLTSLTLTAALIDKSPLTLWFINVIFLYYLALPFLWFVARSNVKIIAVGVISGGVLYLLHRFTPLVDNRIYIYLPSMIFGVLLGKNCDLRSVLTKKLYVVSSATLLLVSLFSIYMGGLDLDCVIALIPIISFPALIAVSEKVSNIRGTHRFWVLIGYASFSAFLFHRVVYEIVYNLSGNVVFAPLVILVVPMIFIASYFVQAIYDKKIKSLSSKS
ncbi:MAG: acyltransferase family protein [Alcanivorax sp.]